MKIAIITGASSGMGRECAIQLADRFGGLDEMWLIARREEKLTDLEKILPVSVKKICLDLAKTESISKINAMLAEEKPNVKFLVNAAGFGKEGKTGEVSFENEIGMIRLNCAGLCAMTHIVLPYMSSNGRIIQFASAASFLPQPGFNVYAATKSFVVSYSRALNQELVSRNIKVTAVCPGPVNTDFFTIAEENVKAPIYKHFLMADPKKVVRCAIRDSIMGKDMSVYGIVIKCTRILCKIFPHKLLIRIFFK